jgi:NTP pyrophosphatase (non-canonical NTP hydrolase)
MKPEYYPVSIFHKLGYLVEECGEVLAAVGKTQRWGLNSCNPEPGASRETNREWILRELADLENACAIVRQALDGSTGAEFGRSPTT